MLDRFDRFPSTTALMLASGAFLMSATAYADPKPENSKMHVPQNVRQPRSKARAFVPAALVDAPRLAAPRVSSGVRQVELEVRDQEPGHSAAIERVSVPLSDRGPTKLDSWLRGGRYKLQIMRESPDMPNALSVELHREPRSADPGSADIATSAVVRIEPGQRVVIARIERSNGSRTEVLATIR
jgi:hypothetical protein